MPKISYFTKVYDKEPVNSIEFDDYLTAVKVGKWEDQVLDYRTGKMRKELLPAVTASGLFNARNTKGLAEHSGYINIDLDSKENPEKNLLQIREELYADEYVYAGHISVSGAGLSLYIKINASKHYEAFCALEKYFANKYDLVVDQKAKDVPRLRFISHDPDLHINKKAKKWTEYIEKTKQPPRHYGDYVASSSDFDYIIEQIKAKGVNIAEDYNDWLRLGFAFASEFGEAGRGNFHIVSSMSSKYDADACDKKYDNCMKASKTGATIRTFYWMAKNAGIEIKSQRTRKIEQVARLRSKQVGKSGGYESKDDAMQSAAKYLADVEGISGGDVKQVIEQVANLQDYQLNVKSDLQTKIENCMQIINGAQVVYNVITGKLETKGKQLTDNDVNSLYIDLIEADDSVARELFNTIINSNRVKSFDPFLDFIDQHKNVKSEGNIKKLLNTLHDYMTYNEMTVTDYKDVFVKKWLLSIMASIHGTYSLMILVLTGPQMIQKTNWFRWLLPDELRMYYAESKLDAGKDDEILMTQKLIIVDDEFGGKSKQEAKKLKDLSSKQYFSVRRPYGKFAEDIRRIAVLGGTSNDDEVLNDPTGNRRIIPLRVNNIDIDAYKKIDKTALFMEIFREWERVGEDWMLTPDEVEMLNKTTARHEQEVSEFQLINKYYEQDDMYSAQTTSTDIKVYLEQVTQQRLSLYKIGQSLNKLGYVKKSTRQGKNVVQVWNVSQRFGNM